MGFRVEGFVGLGVQGALVGVFLLRAFGFPFGSGGLFVASRLVL